MKNCILILTLVFSFNAYAGNGSDVGGKSFAPDIEDIFNSRFLMGGTTGNGSDVGRSANFHKLSSSSPAMGESFDSQKRDLRFSLGGGTTGNGSDVGNVVRYVGYENGVVQWNEYSSGQVYELEANEDYLEQNEPRVMDAVYRSYDNGGGLVSL